MQIDSRTDMFIVVLPQTSMQILGSESMSSTNSKFHAVQCSLLPPMHVFYKKSVYKKMRLKSSKS